MGHVLKPKLLGIQIRSITKRTGLRKYGFFWLHGRSGHQQPIPMLPRSPHQAVPWSKMYQCHTWKYIISPCGSWYHDDHIVGIRFELVLLFVRWRGRLGCAPVLPLRLPQFLYAFQRCWPDGGSEFNIAESGRLFEILFFSEWVPSSFSF